MSDERNHELAAWLELHYDLAQPPHVTLLRAYTNDVYRVETGPARFALKVYGSRWRSDADIMYEIELLRHLGLRGVSVATPVDGVDGEALQNLGIDGDCRQAVLFEWARGAKPTPPFTPAMYHREGMAAARLHQAADDFVSPHARPSLDLETLIERPLAMVEALAGCWETSELRQIGAAASLAIQDLARDGLDWGPCHGDLTFDNFHLTDQGETVWYDFDSGGPGWRAIDLQGWAATMPDRSRDWSAFLDGYRFIRPLRDNDVLAAPRVWLAQEIWSVWVDLERRIMAQGVEAVGVFLAERTRQLNEQARAIGVVTAG